MTKFEKQSPFKNHWTNFNQTQHKEQGTHDKLLKTKGQSILIKETYLRSFHSNCRWAIEFQIGLFFHILNAFKPKRNYFVQISQGGEIVQSCKMAKINSVYTAIVCFLLINVIYTYINHSFVQICLLIWTIFQMSDVVTSSWFIL